ncbi:CU044_5270 family protein [Nonomuraea basaltis]|uniref:CU044_5270 family protein n=1 Tax=Nonomuraea basaltis TaxID=2495887 RepID=UPI00110C5F59|nr:CU044_5270 family protein [Nonomuraea basaltis]TMR91886.1 hypothetical protein EJK15_47535 [Nonomuraea basaltis]
MNDELEMIARIRPEAAPYSERAKLAARRKLLTTQRKRRPYGITIASVVAAAAAASVVAVNVSAPAGQTRGGIGTPAVVALPKIAKMSAVEVLGKAAGAATDLRPRDDQFVKVSSQTMYGSFALSATNEQTGEKVPESRYLNRTRRTIWLSADGTRDGSLRIEHLEPLPYPGWPIPEGAHRNKGSQWMRLPACGAVPATAYTELKKLPADAEAMRHHLYAKDHNKNSADVEAWTAVGDLLRETYMPAAQRAALYEAAATIPGVTVTENAEDAAGRKGIGVGRVSNGVREEIIFDPTSYELLGVRGVVVDEKEAKSPVGSLVTSTAQLTVSVVDEAPEVADEADEAGKEDVSDADCG